MASKLALYSAALRHIGERKLASLSENREPRRVLDDCYDQVVAECLEAGQWNFAMRTVQVDSSASLTPAFGYAYGFDKPEDWVRTAGISSSELFHPTLLRFLDETDYWMADVDPIFVRFVSNDTEFGMDLGRWPPGFTRFVELSLAAAICERLTQNASKGEILRRDAKIAERKAKSTDAMNGATPRFMPRGTWVLSRFGGVGARGRRYDRG